MARRGDEVCTVGDFAVFIFGAVFLGQSLGFGYPFVSIVSSYHEGTHNAFCRGLCS